MRLASLPPLPHANDLGGPIGASPREALGLVRMLRFLLEADDPDAMLARAVASLGLLPEIAWAELDGAAPGDVNVALGEAGTGHVLAVGLVAPEDAGARALIEGLLELVAGVHARDRAMRRLEADATTDPLTSLWNRRGFDPLLDHAIARAARTGEDIALVLVDVDNFKAINDGLGHAHGDRALVGIAEAVRAVIRPTDVAARLGGDEIAILLAGADAEGASRMCERLQETIERTNPVGPHPLTVSMGVADLGAVAKPIASSIARAALFEAADVALYAAKQGGRARTVCHPRAIAPRPVEIDDEPTMPICVGL